MQTASQITEQLRQNVEQINTRLRDMEIHQSEFVGKLDSDAQTTTTHLKEVNSGIQSVAQALENVSAKLNYTDYQSGATTESCNDLLSKRSGFGRSSSSEYPAP